MEQTSHSASRHRFQFSALLLLVVGLFSISSPGSFKNAHLHHRSPASSSRSSRHLNRSRANGSSRTSADAEVEPEIASTRVTAAPPEHSQQLAVLVTAARTIFAPVVCISCVTQDDPAIALLDAPLPHLGLAPPVA